MDKFKDLKKLFTFLDLADFREIPIDNFAYIGDAVIALRYKMKVLEDGRKKTRKINDDSINFISAKAHSKFIDKVLDKFSEEEFGVYKRALNSKGAKKRGNDLNYRKSTGFEAVVGYLFLKERYDRLLKIFEVIESCMHTEETY
ncbi:mini-ribonuclease 3 [Tepiditoga spiralis]|uniref:Mini-ribonuclease 3 n=1 Tax=Tepiditoga spiralis TaxID=2108365 RepID=A0A7G1GBZ1_9BACT|nr:ribonuclease III domain-containing protein [Tepiditoga spiralis]BBE32102.1 mini-ribonuclease 3 [Tepiditoga spiralis]